MHGAHPHDAGIKPMSHGAEQSDIADACDKAEHKS
jgi:hypothetical protein